MKEQVSKHTPGPWKFYPDHSIIEYGPGDFGGFKIVHKGGTHDADADGHLVAAAPDLLEACKESALALSQHPELLSKVIKAIVKAEGKAQ